MATELPKLVYFDLAERKHGYGYSLVSTVCKLANCASPMGAVSASGLQLSAKHSKNRTDKGRLTAGDLRALADLIDELAKKEAQDLGVNDTMTGEDDGRRDAA